MNKICRYLFCITALVKLTACDQGKTCDCKKFKDGNFIYKSGSFYFDISRKDSIQIETDPKNGCYTKLLIKWVDECNYMGVFLESTFPFSDSLKSVQKENPINVKIISTGNDYYVFKAYRKNSPELIDTLWKVKN